MIQTYNLQETCLNNGNGECTFFQYASMLSFLKKTMYFLFYCCVYQS